MGPMIFLAFLLAAGAGIAYASGVRLVREGDSGPPKPGESEAKEEVDAASPEVADADPVDSTVDAATDLLQAAAESGCSAAEIEAARKAFEAEVGRNPLFAFLGLRGTLDACLGTKIGEPAAAQELDAVPPPPPVFDSVSPGLPPFPGSQTLPTGGDPMREAGILVTRATMKCGFAMVPRILALQDTFVVSAAAGDPSAALATLTRDILAICPEARA